MGVFYNKLEVDPAYMKITEESIKANTHSDYSEWISIKDSIRLDLPYPV